MTDQRRLELRKRKWKSEEVFVGFETNPVFWLLFVHLRDPLELFRDLQALIDIHTYTNPSVDPGIFFCS